jgi:transposase
MKPPLFVRELSDAERRTLHAGLRSREAFTLRRAQILLASAEGQRPARIAAHVGCAVGTVHNTIHAFEKQGTDCLGEKKRGPKDAQPILDEAKADPLKGILHQSPRRFGKARSTWTLDLLADVAFEQELTPRRLSHEAVRQAVKRLGHGWKRAKQWITSPDPAYARKKKARDRLIRLAASHPEWVLGYQDECWWSRLALPAMHAWTSEDRPLRLVEQTVPKGDTDPKALSCYGLLRADTGRMLVRFVQGRPVSQVTEDYLAWVCERLGAEGKKALLLVWDNAAWHVSKRVRAWIKSHNRKARAEGGVRIVACFLPVKSPWLNPIEPKWAHGKKAIVEPERLLAANEVRTRVCDYYGCEHLEPLAQLSA